MNRLGLFLLFFLLPWLCNAQQSGTQLVDSLRKELAKSGNDSFRVLLQIQLSKYYSRELPDSGIAYAELAKNLSTEIGFSRGSARAYHNLGLNFEAKSQNGDALENYLLALKEYEKVKDRLDQATVLGDIGNIYTALGQFEKAYAYDSAALYLFESLQYRPGELRNLGNLALVCQNLGRNKQAHLYFERVLKEAGENNAPDELAKNYGNLAVLYYTENNFAEAIRYGEKAIQLYETRVDYKKGLASNLGNLGEFYMVLSKDSTLMHNKTRSREALEKAIALLRRAIEVSREVDFMEGVAGCYETLGKAYELSGDYPAALQAVKAFHDIKDSISGASVSLKITGLETVRAKEIKEREKEILLLRKRSELVYFIFGIVILVGITAVSLRNNYIQRSSNLALAREKRKSEKLLLNILPHQVAEELKETGVAAAKYFDNVTVMFTDFVAFTSAGERMTPQELVNELHTCFVAFDEITEKYNIEKIKTIGDAYLAVAGLNTHNPQHAVNVISAAKDIIAFMNQRYQEKGDTTFKIRIGIHSGSVVAGIVGVKKFIYDIWGDTVNTAARMEQNSEPGKINITEHTHLLVKDIFPCTYRGEIEAKNKGKLKMYFVDTDL